MCQVGIELCAKKKDSAIDILQTVIFPDTWVNSY
jgi:hypothetical protein